MLLGGLAVGGVAAVIGAGAIVPHVDPLASIPPEPIWVMPVGAMVGVTALLLLAAVTGGWIADRAARRVGLGEAMRVDV